MSLIKHGTGDIIGPDNEDLKKTAKPDWTEADDKALEEENTDGE